MAGNNYIWLVLQVSNISQARSYYTVSHFSLHNFYYMSNSKKNKNEHTHIYNMLKSILLKNLKIYKTLNLGGEIINAH